MKMIIYNKSSVAIFCFSFALLFTTGCKKQLDINQNPNFPTFDQATPALLFPAAVLATTGKVGGDLAIVGGIWSQFFTQSSLANQYTAIESYNMPSTSTYVNASYDLLFTNGLKNYQAAMDKAKASGDWNYYLMSTVMKAYTTEVLVDLYDQIPFTQALQGASNLDPKFDDGFSIYQSLINSIDTALNQDFSASTNTAPGSQDMIFNGNMDQWKAFANTLLLKLYLRMVNAHMDVATAGITALYATNPTFLATDASVANFTDAPGLDNPFYEQNQRQLNTNSNLKASTTFVSWLEANADPRIVYYYGSTNPSSINQGDYTNNNPTYQAAPVFAQTPTDPVEFISLPESYFLQAEADVRFFGGANAQSLYEQGVLAAFTQLKINNTPLDGSSFIAPGGVYAWGAEVEGGITLGPIEQIIRQKWASCAYGCHGIESYFDKNRTGFPKSSDGYYTPTYVAGQLVIGKNSVLGTGLVPKRFVFPYDETSRNENSPSPVPSTTAVWWGL